MCYIIPNTEPITKLIIALGLLFECWHSSSMSEGRWPMHERGVWLMGHGHNFYQGSMFMCRVAFLFQRK